MTFHCSISNTQLMQAHAALSLRKVPFMHEIIDVVSAVTGISVAEIKSRGRTRDVVAARHVAVWLCNVFTRKSYIRIAKAFGMKDHTTVLHALAKVEATRAKYHDVIEEVCDCLGLDAPSIGYMPGPPRPPAERWSDADVEALKRLVADGFKQKQIPPLIGRTEKAINRKIHRMRLQDAARS